MVGAFHQPGAVLIDPRFLETLPPAEYRSGMAEVIKHAVIQPSTPLGGATLRAALESASTLAPLPVDAIEDVLTQNVALKASVVRADEREDGLRKILNFGHTAGHAIEADGYRYRHGEAVAVGMLVATRIAERLGRVANSELVALERIIHTAGLPTSFTGAVDRVLANLVRDKKTVDGATTWILPMQHGGVEPVTDVPIEAVREALVAAGATP
jgi:3-dehydroquinate synthetase